MNEQPTTTAPLRPRRRIALRWFIIAALLLVIGGGLAIGLPIYQEQKAAAELEAIAYVRREYRGPAWLSPHLGGAFKRPFLVPVEVGSTRFPISVRTSNKVKEGLLVRLEHLPNLRIVYLTETSISGAELARLVEAPELDTLWLVRCRLSADAFPVLARASRLHSLNLSQTSVTDEDLKSIARLPRLEHLSLDGTAVSDEGLRHLATLAKLRELSASNTQVTDAGVSALTGKNADLAVYDD